MSEQPSSPTVPVLCKHTQKFLAKLDSDGIHLWCKGCKMYHSVSWTLLQQSFQEIEQKHPVAAVRTA